jgi:ABC-type transport system involved in cytochrome bd biosynthesis fused ATPase/permease subunit
VNADALRLLRWLRRSRPPRGVLLRALLSGVVATATGVGLLAGAVALLVVSASRPGLGSVAGVLIIIELLAFLRSPIRFAERLSSHRLGFSAVTQWRHWLVINVGRWNFAKWRSYAAGDLLERSLRDTDELQDLWLRCAIPVTAAAVTALLGDLIISLLAPHGSWWAYAGLLAVLQILGFIGLLSNFGPLISADRTMRTVRGSYVATLVELSAVTPELALLGRLEYAQRRSNEAHRALARAERRLRRQRRAASGVPVAVTAAAVGVLVVHHPLAAPVWTVVAALLALATFDALTTVQSALDTAVAVSAAAERLESLEVAPSRATAPWIGGATLSCSHVQVREEGRILLDDVTFVLAPGRRLAITGPSGSGKSTLLRALARLDPVDAGEVRVGSTLIGDIDEDELRRQLAYVAAEPGLFRGFALDVVALGRTGTRDPEADLMALGIDANRSTKWEELSRGERERVAVVRALVTSPQVLLLDEPTSGLGRAETLAVLHMLESAGASVVVATHDPVVMSWCDQVLEVRERELRAR